MSDSGSLFNFIQPNRILADNFQGKRISENSTSSKKRKSESVLYSHIKIPRLGQKLIKIEIYDVEKMKSEDLCKCDADICCQHIVKSIFNDDVYKLAQDLISKIGEHMIGENMSENRNLYL